MDFPLTVLRHAPGFGAVGGDQPKVVVAVRHRQRASVRGPHRRVVEAGGEMGDQRFRPAGGRTDRDLLFAAAIGGVGQRPPVRRPGRMVLVGVAGAGNVADRAVLGRHRDDVAARRERGPAAIGRQGVVHPLRGVGGAYHARRLGPARGGARAVVRHVGVDPVRRLVRQVDRPQVAALPERDGAVRVVGTGAEGRKVDVVVGEVRDLAELLAVQVVHPDVGAAVLVAVGQEVDPAPDPHRRGVGALPVGDAGQRPGREVVGVDVLGAAAVVALPGAEVAEDAGEGDGVVVRAKRHQAAAVERQRYRQAAGNRHLEQTVLRRVPVHATRHEHDVLRVRGPGDHHVVRTPARRRLGHHVGMKGEAPRLAAPGRDHVDVLVALRRGGVGDPLPVRRVARHHVLAGIRGQARGSAAFARHRPQVAVRHEHDAVAMRVREPHQRRRRRSRRIGGERARQGGGGEQPDRQCCAGPGRFGHAVGSPWARHEGKPAFVQPVKRTGAQDPW